MGGFLFVWGFFGITGRIRAEVSWRTTKGLLRTHRDLKPCQEGQVGEVAIPD